MILRTHVIVCALLTDTLLTFSVQGADTVSLALAPIVRRDEDREGDERPVTGTLVRDLARQALLVAARDELGLRTIDAALREQGSDEDEVLSLELTADARLNKECAVRIVQTVDGKPAEVFSHVFKFKANAREAYQTLTPQFEEFSRGEFVELLKKLGAAAQDVPEVVETPEGEYAAAIEDIDGLLASVDLVSQFVAVRNTHAAIAKWGESRDALVRLVRGYAHLGLLTETSWSPATNVMKARSLVYAARLLAKHPDDAASREARAYAHALAGIHFAALKDLKKLDAEKAEGDGENARPAWVGLIGPYCNYDMKGPANAGRGRATFRMGQLLGAVGGLCDGRGADFRRRGS